MIIFRQVGRIYPTCPTSTSLPLCAQLADAGEDLWLCEGDTVQIGKADTSGGNCTFTWSGTGPIEDAAAPIARVWPQADATYILTVNDTVYGGSCGMSTDSVLRKSN